MECIVNRIQDLYTTKGLGLDQKGASLAGPGLVVVKTQVPRLETACRAHLKDGVTNR